MVCIGLVLQEGSPKPLQEPGFQIPNPGSKPPMLNQNTAQPNPRPTRKIKSSLNPRLMPVIAGGQKQKRNPGDGLAHCWGTKTKTQSWRWLKALLGGGGVWGKNTQNKRNPGDGLKHCWKTTGNKNGEEKKERKTKHGETQKEEETTKKRHPMAPRRWAASAPTAPAVAAAPRRRAPRCRRGRRRRRSSRRRSRSRGCSAWRRASRRRRPVERPPTPNFAAAEAPIGKANVPRPEPGARSPEPGARSPEPERVLGCFLLCEECLTVSGLMEDPVVGKNSKF